MAKAPNLWSGAFRHDVCTYQKSTGQRRVVNGPTRAVVTSPVRLAVGTESMGDHGVVPTELAVALVALVGSAGVASIITSAGQLTRAARLRRRIERHTALAKSFPPESVPARSLTMTARISAVELSARTCVVLSPTVIFLSFSMGALAITLALAVALSLFEVSSIAIPWLPPSVVMIGLNVALLLVTFAAFYPLIPLSVERAKLERKLLAEPAFLSDAMKGDARIVIGLDRRLVSAGLW